MDSRQAVPVPERQEADPYIVWPVRRGHIKRFALPVGVCVLLTGSVYQGNPLFLLAFGAAVGLALSLTRIGGVSLDRWVRNRFRHARRPQRYASRAQGKDVPSRRFLPVKAIRSGVLAAPFGKATRHSIIVQVRPANYHMMNRQEQETALASLHTVLGSTEHHIQLLTRTRPFDTEGHITTFAGPLRQQTRPDLRRRTLGMLRWLDAFTRSRNILQRQYYIVFGATAGNHADKAVRALQSAAESAASQLTAGGATATVLTGTEARDILEGMLNPEAYATRSRRKRKQRRRGIHVPDIGIHRDHIQVGNDLLRTLRITTYPDALRPAWLDELLALREHIDVSVQAEAKDPFTARRRLKAVKTDLIIHRSKKIKQGADVTEDDLKIQDIQRQLEQVLSRETVFFETSIYITVHATQAKDLEKLTDRVEQALRNEGMHVFVEPWTQEEAFLSTLPLATDFPAKDRQTMDTACLTASYPFLFGAVHHETGNLLGFHAHTGSLYIADPYVYQNHNIIVAGTSGSGKSYSVKLDLMRSLMRKPRMWIYIIDPLREFGDTTLALGGQLVFVGNATTVLNPFDIDEPSKNISATEVPESPFQSKLAYLEGLFSLVLADEDDYHLSILMDAIHGLYQDHGITEDPETWNRTPPVLADLVTKLAALAASNQDVARAAALRRLEAKLAPKANGPLKPLNGHTNVDTRSRVVTFDLNSLDEKWYRVFMFVVLEFIQRRTFSDVKDPKRIVVDEAWLLMDHEETSRALDHLSRHVRHYHAGLTLITQTPESFLENKHGRAVLANTMQTFLFRQRHVPSDVREAYGLDEEDARMLLRIGQAQHMDHSECVYIAGNDKAYLQIHSSPAEHRLITTKPEEVAQRLQEKEVP